MALIVKSNIKSVCGDMNVAGDVGDALERKAEQMLKDAVERAKANKRKTVMAQDL